MSGSARDVLQARDVRGGIHFHADRAHGVLVPRQLPGDVSGFVGRTRDLERLDQFLTEDAVTGQGVCVVAGTAGVGKTSLAVHWAHLRAARFPDGQLYANLRGFDVGEPVTAHRVLERFLPALGLAPTAIPAETEARSELLRSLLADRRVLIVLDNAATAGQVRPLLPGSQGCLTLVTSRNRMSGLVARDGAGRVTLDVFPEHEAAHLVRAVTADYRTDDDDREVAELARLCARLPLALRIAAERAAARPHMPLDELIQDLRDASSVWDTLASEDDEEADVVRSVFAWSYRALPASSARMFRLLGLHPGADFSAHAAAAVTGVAAAESRRLVDGLVGAHLVEQTARDRFQFHDLLRAYALDLALGEEDDAERFEAVSRLSSWYLSAASAAGDALADPQVEGWGIYDWGIAILQPPGFGVPDLTRHDSALAWLDAEADNALAVSRAAARAGLDEIAWKLPAVLLGPFADRHPIRSWIPVGEAALEAAQRAGDKLGQVAVLLRLGVSYRLSQQVQHAIDAHTKALAIANEIGRERVTAAALFLLGVAQERGRLLDQAWDSYQQALEAARHSGSALWTGWARNGLAGVLFEKGELAAAAKAIELTLRDPSPNAIARAESLWFEAMILRETGQAEQARTSIIAAVEIAHARRITVSEAAFKIEHGRVLLAAREPQEALTVLDEAVAMHQHLGDRSREADALDAVGEAYQALGRLDDAAEAHRQAADRHEALSDPWHRAVALTNLAAALDQLGDADQAAEHRAIAARLIEPYDDPRAARMRSRIAAASAER